MKRMKKFLAVLLAAVMVMAMGSVSVFAGTLSVNVQNSDNGSVTADKTTDLDSGDVVTLSVSPSSGYALSSLVITDSNGSTVTPAGSGSTYTFEMPDTNVTVNATFVHYSITIVDDDSTTGTIGGASEGETYSVYKIFDVTYSGTAYAYTISKTSSFWSAIAGISNYDSQNTTQIFKLTESASDSNVYVVELMDDYADGKDDEVTDAVISAIKSALANADLSIDPDKTATAASGATSVTINVDEPGYYYVSTSTGSVVSLNTAAPTAEVEDKNTAPSVEKTVLEGNTYGEANTAGIGDTVSFKAEIKNINEASNITFHDKMTDGLTFDGADSVIVKLYKSSTDNSPTTLTQTGQNTGVYSVTTTASDGCTFEIDFSTYLSSLTTMTDDYYLEITYTATVNDKAVIDSAGNTNTAQVSYGNESESKTSTTTTYVYELNVFKYTKPDATESALSGASFVLYKEESSKKYYAIITNGKISGWTETLADATTLTSDTDGMIYIAGLDAGTYYLLETEAPSGYNKLTSAITVTISAGTGNAESLSYTYDSKTSDGATVGSYSNVVKVENNSGSEIPSAGGMGTTILYIIGAILVIGAAVILVTRRRMANK